MSICFCTMNYLNCYIVTVQYPHSYVSKSMKNRLRRWDFDLHVSGFWHIHAKTPRGIMVCWIVTLYLLISFRYSFPIELNGIPFRFRYPIVMVSSVESFTAQYSEPFRFSQIMPLQSVYPFSPFIRFSIVARSFALIDCLYSYVLNTSSAK